MTYISLYHLESQIFSLRSYQNKSYNGNTQVTSILWIYLRQISSSSRPWLLPGPTEKKSDTKLDFHKNKPTTLRVTYKIKYCINCIKTFCAALWTYTFSSYIISKLSDISINFWFKEWCFALTLSCIILKNGQTYFKNITV